MHWTANWNIHSSLRSDSEFPTSYLPLAVDLQNCSDEIVVVVVAAAVVAVVVEHEDVQLDGFASAYSLYYDTDSNNSEVYGSPPSNFASPSVIECNRFSTC